MSLSVLLAGGGTAGHIEPALNLADVLRRRYPDADIALLGTELGLETKLVPERGYPLELIPAVPLPRRINRDLSKVAGRLRNSIKATRRVMDSRDTQIIVGFGGYVAMPAYFAGRRRVPIVVHEANAKPGLANRVGARMTPFVAQAVPGALANAITLGLPLRPAIVELDRAAQRAEARQKFGLDPDGRTVLVFGGSLGARRINDAVLDAVAAINAAGVGVVHAIGLNNEDQLKLANTMLSPLYRPLPFIDRMDLAYAAVDLVVCRAGAMTCAELAAVGLPAVYVPLPIGNGEQRLNARATVEAGGGEFLDDSDLAGAAISQTVIRLLAEQTNIETMSAAAATRGIRDAGDKLADLVERAISGGRAK